MKRIAVILSLLLGAALGGILTALPAGAAITPTVKLTPSSNPASLPQPGGVRYYVSVSPSGVTQATGTVTVNDGTNTCIVTLSRGAGGCQLSEGAGSYSVVATYSGDSNFNSATSNTVTEQVNQTTPTVAVSTNYGRTGSVVYNTTLTNIHGVAPTGAVTISDGTNSCSAPLSSGRGSCSLLEGAGTYTITASYPGDANYTSSSGHENQTIAPVTPAVTLTGPTSPAPPLDQYNVTVTGAPGIAPTGTVTISDGVTTPCTATLSGGSGSCSLAEPVGYYTVTATYNGDSSYKTNHTDLGERVNKGTPAMILKALANPHYLPGDQVTYYAIFPTDAPVPVTGTVTISDGTSSCVNQTIVVATPPAAPGSGAHCTFTEAAGTYTVSATYSGDSNYLPISTPQTITENVDKWTPTLSLTSNLNPAVLPQANGIKYFVGIGTRGGVPATGPVTISDGTNTCTATLSNGTGNCYLVEAAGSYTVTATYDGDSNYNGQTQSMTETVNLATPTINVSSTQNKAGSVTYTAAIVTQRSVLATGTITISDGTTSCTTGSLVNGAASCALVEGAGSYTITASYAGDANYAAGNGTLSWTIGQATPSMQLTPATNPAPVGLIQFTASFTGAAIAPTGTVTVSATGVLGSCTITLSGGTGSCNLDIPASGTYTINGVYSGDSNYKAVTVTTSETVS